jgi:hypothetical protein
MHALHVRCIRAGLTVNTPSTRTHLLSSSDVDPSRALAHVAYNNPYQPARSSRRRSKWLCSFYPLSPCSRGSFWHRTTLTSLRAHRATVLSGSVFTTQLTHYNNPYQPARLSHRCSKRLCFLYAIAIFDPTAPLRLPRCFHWLIRHWLWLSIASPQPPRPKLAGFCRLHPALHFSFPRLFPLWNA